MIGESTRTCSLGVRRRLRNTTRMVVGLALVGSMISCGTFNGTSTVRIVTATLLPRSLADDYSGEGNSSYWETDSPNIPWIPLGMNLVDIPESPLCPALFRNVEVFGVKRGSPEFLQGAQPQTLKEPDFGLYASPIK